MRSLISFNYGALLITTAQTLVLPIANDIDLTPLSNLSIIGILRLSSSQPANLTSHPLTFLSVTCFHLLPNTVSLHDCQPVFKQLVSGGRVYNQRELYNGWTFQRPHTPYIIEISSTSPEDRRKTVQISIAMIITHATAVLRDCESSGSGGAMTFEGKWRVIVSRKARTWSAIQVARSE